MHLAKYLTPFVIFNIFLFFVFSITVSELYNFYFVNLFCYVLLHFLIIYLGIYYYRKILYFLYFFYGLALDLLWINQIGPHLLIFMIMLVFFNLIKKYMYNLNSQKIYLIILFIQLLIILLELLFSQLLFQYMFSLNTFIQLSIISIAISFPLLFLFSKIDNL